MTNAVRKYESIPKRKDMVPDSIFHYLAHLYRHASLDSFIHAIIDWIILGCYINFQKSELRSDHPCTFAMIYDPNWGNQPKALPVFADNFSLPWRQADASPMCTPTTTPLSRSPLSAFESRRTMIMVRPLHVVTAMT